MKKILYIVLLAVVSLPSYGSIVKIYDFNENLSSVSSKELFEEIEKKDKILNNTNDYTISYKECLSKDILFAINYSHNTPKNMLVNNDLLNFLDERYEFNLVQNLIKNNNSSSTNNSDYFRDSLKIIQENIHTFKQTLKDIVEKKQASCLDITKTLATLDIIDTKLSRIKKEFKIKNLENFYFIKESQN